MRRMLQECAVLLGLLVCASGLDAQTVQQTGSVTGGHMTCWSTTGVIKDCGTASSPVATSIGVLASGSGICQQSGPSSGAFNRICLTATSTSGGVAMTNVGGATGGFTFTLNGVTQGIATVTLPVTTGDAACFADSTGTLNDCGLNPSSFVVGPAISINNDIAVFNGTTGKLIADGGVPLGTLPTGILPNVNAGHKVPILNTDVEFSGNYLGFVNSGTGFGGIVQGSPTVVVSGTPTAAETPGVQFQWTDDSGAHNITVRYTVVGGNTNANVAAALVVAINANATIAASSVAGKCAPCLFAYYLGDVNFNLQWHYSTPTTLTASNSAHTTITIPASSAAIDAIIVQLGRAWSGRTTLAGDTLVGLDWTGPNSTSSGALATHWAQITPYISDPTAGTGQGCIRFGTGSSSVATGNNAIARLLMCAGLVLYDSSQVIALNGDRGAGTINIPVTGGYYIGGGAVAISTGLYAQGSNVFGGTAANATLVLQATDNGSPSGDFVQIKAGGVVGYKFDGTTSTYLGSGGSLFTNITAPGSPAAGKVVTYTDSTDLRLHDKNASGVIGTTVVADTGASNNFLTAISAAGVISKAQPTFSNLATGTAPAFTLGGTVSGGGNQINNVVLGTTTPLAATVTTLTANTSVTSPIFKSASGTAQFTSGANNGITITNTGTIGMSCSISPLTQFEVCMAANQNSVWVAGASTSVGGNAIGIWSINDAGTVANPMELRGSQVYVRAGDGAGLSIGTTTNLGEGTVLANGAIKTLSTTVSSSATTGSGIFGGGIGVSGDVWASGNHAVSTAAKTLLLKQGANGAVGTFICTGAGTITINNTNVATSDTIIISMAAAGGTITTPPAFKTITGATGFTVLCGATDTSTYNYAIIKNAA